ALTQEVERFSTLTGIPARFSAPSSLALPQAEAEHILRYVAEGLANIARHAQASRVDVAVGVGENLLVVDVCDNGVGFDPASLRNNGHYGLLGLQERARLMGASLEVDSAVGNGTKLRLRVPRRVKEEVLK